MAVAAWAAAGPVTDMADSGKADQGAERFGHRAGPARALDSGTKTRRAAPSWRRRRHR
jgi:hypothetical protein